MYQFSPPHNFRRLFLTICKKPFWKMGIVEIVTCVQSWSARLICNLSWSWCMIMMCLDASSIEITLLSTWEQSFCIFSHQLDVIWPSIINQKIEIGDLHPILFVFVFVTPVLRFLQSYWRGYLEDSWCFNGDPPHLTLNHNFPVIRLSRPKKVAWANALSALL